MAGPLNRQQKLIWKRYSATFSRGTMLRENKRRGMAIVGMQGCLTKKFPETQWGWVWSFKRWPILFSEMKAGFSKLKSRFLANPTILYSSKGIWVWIWGVVGHSEGLYLQYLSHVLSLQRLLESVSGFSFQAGLRPDPGCRGVCSVTYMLCLSSLVSQLFDHMSHQ